MMDIRRGTCTEIDWSTGVASVIIPGVAATLRIPFVGAPPALYQLCWIGVVRGVRVVLGKVGI